MRRDFCLQDGTVLDPRGCPCSLPCIEQDLEAESKTLAADFNGQG